MKKTPEEIEAMAKVLYPPYWLEDENGPWDDNQSRRAGFVEGYTSNNELEEFKKRLVEKLEAMRKPDEEHPSIRDEGYISGIGAAIVAIKFMTSQDLKRRWKEDQPPVKKEEI